MAGAVASNVGRSDGNIGGKFGYMLESPSYTLAEKASSRWGNMCSIRAIPTVVGEKSPVRTISREVPNIGNPSTTERRASQKWDGDTV